MSGFGKQPSCFPPRPGSGMVPLDIRMTGKAQMSSTWSEPCPCGLLQESQLEDEQGKNEQLKEEADLLRRKAQLLDQVSVELSERFVFSSLWSGSQFHSGGDQSRQLI